MSLIALGKTLLLVAAALAAAATVAATVLFFIDPVGVHRGGCFFAGVGLGCTAETFRSQARGHYRNRVGKTVDRATQPEVFKRILAWQYLLGVLLILFGLFIWSLA